MEGLEIFEGPWRGDQVLVGWQAAETFAASVDGEASEHSAGGKRGAGLSMAREATDSIKELSIERSAWQISAVKC